MKDVTSRIRRFVALVVVVVTEVEVEVKIKGKISITQNTHTHIFHKKLITRYCFFTSIYIFFRILFSHIYIF